MIEFNLTVIHESGKTEGWKVTGEELFWGVGDYFHPTATDPVKRLIVEAR